MCAAAARDKFLPFAHCCRASRNKPNHGKCKLHSWLPALTSACNGGKSYMQRSLIHAFEERILMSAI